MHDIQPLTKMIRCFVSEAIMHGNRTYAVVDNHGFRTTHLEIFDTLNEFPDWFVKWDLDRNYRKCTYAISNGSKIVIVHDPKNLKGLTIHGMIVRHEQLVETCELTGNPYSTYPF